MKSPYHIARIVFASAALLLCQGFVFAAGAKRITASELTSAATTRPSAQMPAMARQLKLQGNVEVDVTVDNSGAVQNTSGLRGNPILMKAAIDAVKGWKFKPFSEPVVATITFEFHN